MVEVVGGREGKRGDRVGHGGRGRVRGEGGAEWGLDVVIVEVWGR